MNRETITYLLDLTRRRITNDTMKSIDIAMALESYSDSIIEMIKLNDGDESMAITSMAHDYVGLSSNDADFLPRLTLNA